ncbi:PAS domain-containing protein [Methylobacterium sp.]|uniref:PAS domain-containing protein n=1 Tax=Methylobacterium sp. TaxID=409 RepID=UPI00257ADB6E|nr:PAS domain-containing protein [Methylobacterium sp.]
MRKLKSDSDQTCTVAFQQALDDLSVVGNWELDAAIGQARADALVAMLFGVDPQDAQAGLPLASFINGIHPDDRQRVSDQIYQAVQQGSPYVSE